MTPRERRIRRELIDLLVKGELETYVPATIRIKNGKDEIIRFLDFIPIKIKVRR